MTRIPFGRPDERNDPLLARAAELPREVPPPHDLWPAIAARIAGTPAGKEQWTFRWPMALAAAVAVAAVSALLTWGVLRDETRAPAAVMTVPEIIPVNYGSRSGLTAAEIAARDDLYGRFRERFAELKPETRATIRKNLAVIQAAADEIDAALAQDPASGMLNGLLVGAYKQELQLYSMVVTTGDRTTRRT